MSRPTCAGSLIDPHCDRNVMRYRNGNGYCLWHPTEEPPVMDPKTGRPVSAKPTKTAAPKHLEPAPAPDDLAELQADLDELEATDPAVAAAAASYDTTVDRILTRDPEPEPQPQSAPELPVADDPPPSPASPLPDPNVLAMRITAEHCQHLATDPALEHAVRCIAQLAVGALTALIAHGRPTTAAVEAAAALPEQTPPAPKKKRTITPEGRQAMRDNAARMRARQAAKLAAARDTR